MRNINLRLEKNYKLDGREGYVEEKAATHPGDKGFEWIAGKLEETIDILQKTEQ